MKALLIVDVQNDFCLGGSLAVPSGDEVVPVINNLMDEYDLVAASKDWHLESTAHFEKWPPHCIQNSMGAEFHPDLDSEKIDYIFFKGTGNKDDGYSAFEATNENLAQWLKDRGVEQLTVVGLATDYCVKESVMDALKMGFATIVITAGVRAVDVNPGDGEKALMEMEKVGAKII